MEDPPFRFRVVIDAWKDEEQNHFHWHRLKGPFETLPESFSEQFALLNSCWSEVAGISVKDLAC